eukprot:283911-Amphidinium_carterae.1
MQPQYAECAAPATATQPPPLMQPHYAGCAAPTATQPPPLMQPPPPRIAMAPFYRSGSSNRPRSPGRPPSRPPRGTA